MPTVMPKRSGWNQVEAFAIARRVFCTPGSLSGSSSACAAKGSASAIDAAQRIRIPKLPRIALSPWVCVACTIQSESTLRRETVPKDTVLQSKFQCLRNHSTRRGSAGIRARREAGLATEHLRECGRVRIAEIERDRRDRIARGEARQRGDNAGLATPGGEARAGLFAEQARERAPRHGQRRAPVVDRLVRRRLVEEGAAARGELG